MNKKKAISIITRAARLYHENLEDQKVFVIMSKSYTAEKYNIVEKCDKSISIESINGITEYVDIHNTI